MNKIILSVILAGLLAACASTPEQSPAKVEDRTPAAPITAEPAKSEPAPKVTAIERKPVVATPTPAAAANPLKDSNNILSKRSIFFEYDSDAVKDEYKPLITAHAAYLKQNSSAKATIQGNTDERGSREYNLALGQRRADAVKQMMTLLGAPEAQVEAVSFGEEKPRATGKDDTSFAENRRDDIVYQGE